MLTLIKMLVKKEEARRRLPTSPLKNDLMCEARSVLQRLKLTTDIVETNNVETGRQLERPAVR